MRGTVLCFSAYFKSQADGYHRFSGWWGVVGGNQEMFLCLRA